MSQTICMALRPVRRCGSPFIPKTLALHTEDIVARGDREDDPRAAEFAIPSHFWGSGEFRFSERGSWWAPNPQLRLEWGALRFARGDFMQAFPPFRFEPKAPSSKGDWIDVVEALTWEAYGHALTIEDFRAEIAAGKGLSLEHHRICLDIEWRSWRHRFDLVRSPLKGQPVTGEQAGSEQTLDGPSLTAKADLAWMVDETGLPLELCVRFRTVPRTDDLSPQFTEVRTLRFLREKLGAAPDHATGKRETPNPEGARRWLEMIFETHEPGWKTRDELKAIAISKFHINGTQFKEIRDALVKQDRFSHWARPGRPNYR